MIIKGARRPLWLNDNNYGRFSLELKFFLADDASLPNRPEHLVEEQILRADAYNVALDAMNHARNTMRQSTKVVEDAYLALEKKLRWMRNIIPTLFGNDKSCLIPFGLDKKVPRAYEEMKNYADAANAHWQDVRLEPTFAPYAVGCDELADLLDDFETKRMNQADLNREYAERQNEKDLARAAHHELERSIFGHYSAFYTDGQDLYWDQTPWGRAGGVGDQPADPEEDEEPEPEPEPEPGVFYGKATKVAPGTYDLWCSNPAGVVDARVELQKLPDGPVELVTAHMLIEAGEFLPYRLFDMIPADYRAFFTALDSSGEHIGEAVSVDFTVMPY